MNEQLEFDLVSPFLAGSTEEEERLLAEAKAALRQAEAKLNLAKLSAQLRNQDLVIAPQPTDELEQLRVLIGKRSWTKEECRRWQRRLKQSVVDVRKFITILRNLP